MSSSYTKILQCNITGDIHSPEQHDNKDITDITE